MTKRKNKQIELATERRHYRRSFAKPIEEQYPQVEGLKFEFHYRDPDGLATPSSKTFTWSPANLAFFEFECPYLECVDGGHDLTESVSKMLNNDQAECSGTICCQGWQDPERKGQHRCWCELQFKITVTYKDE